MGSNVKTADARALNRLLRSQGNTRLNPPDPSGDSPEEIAREQEVIRKLGQDKKNVAAWAADKTAQQLDNANNAYKIRWYIAQHPDSELAKAVQPYVPLASDDDMKNSEAYKTIKIGAYTDMEVENDVETFYLNKVGKTRSWWEKIKFATKAVLGQKQHEENIQKGIAAGLEQAGENALDNQIFGTKKDTSIYNNAFNNLDTNMENHKDDSLETTVLGEAGKLLKHGAKDVAEWWWITFCRPFASVPMWADILMIMGGVGLGAYSIYQGMQFIAIPSLILAGVGGFCLYAYYFIKSIEPTKDPDPVFGGANDSTNHQASKHD